MKFYKKSSEEVMEILDVSIDGLSEQEVQKRRLEHGYNKLDEAKGDTPIKVFMDQFKDFLVIMLILAAIISAALGKYESTIVVIFVVVLNAILGTVQHIKANNSINSLKALSSPVSKVLRDKMKKEIPSNELVVGDIIFFDAGDYISADARVIEAHSFQVNESSLTGESESVTKEIEAISQDDVSIGDMKNMVFSGSYVTYGRGVAVVTDIGMKTEIGKIASMLENAKARKTPLQETLDNFGKNLSIAILIISGIIFIIDILRDKAIIDSFMFAVALAVAAIPEALSSIVTIVLAFGTQKMSKSNAIVKKLNAVESLGSISVICSDKTGTLTQNKMKVQKLWVDNNIVDSDEVTDQSLINKLIQFSVLCNDAIVSGDSNIGDPTEIALVNLGNEHNINEQATRNAHPRIFELPFDSDRKMMSTVNAYENSKLMITKGAVDTIINKSHKILTSNGVEILNDEVKAKIKHDNNSLAKNGLRVLAFAYKEYKNESRPKLEDEDELIFMGMIAMMDPPRPESKKAVADCILAGIKPVMITGDHKITAIAIAKQIGIINDEAEALEGHEIEKLTDDELYNIVENISVYARVSPEHKIRIVRAWQKKSMVVAMTGDGVNDAPALKQADVGVAMGITGTEVSKEAASMVLTDDNFATIVKAISSGRSIYVNIKNSIKFLLSGNAAGIFSVIFASVAGLAAPFAPVHLLFINLLTDSLPAIAIGLEPHDESIMKEKPRKRTDSIINKEFIKQVSTKGALIALVTMIAYYIGFSSGSHLVGSTMAFATLCLSRLFHSLNCRSKASVFKIGVLSNIYVILSIIVGSLMLLFVMNYPPLMTMFEVSKLDISQHLSVIGLSLIPLVAVQIYKLIKDNNSTSYEQMDKVNNLSDVV